MHVNIMIATHDRWELLKQTLLSLWKQTYKDFSVHVIVDGNLDNIPEWLKRADINLGGCKERGDVVAAWGAITGGCKTGALFNAADDLVFHPSCLSHAVYAMQNRYPRGLGVIGINQLQGGSPKGRKYAFTLMNREYIDHFPGRIVFCPDYIHYRSDMEHGIYAQTIRKFTVCLAAKVEHVSKGSRLNDRTTQLGKMVYKRDRHTWHMRQERGYLWGKNFKRLK
ncbi:hypothetical protein ES703_125646 [subsurface metagenome]